MIPDARPDHSSPELAPRRARRPILLVSKVTSELRPGDLVRHHGMRLRVTEEPFVATGHHMNDQAPAFGEVRLTRAEVENIDDPAIDPFVRRLLDADSPTWTIQGNDLARWTVEVVR
jgi:hypothetical protein